MSEQNVRTAEEARADYVAAMGQELGDLYAVLWQQVAWLYCKWGEYVALFGTDPARVELLNQTAPSFFRVVQDSLWEDILMHLARVTDSPRTAGRSNLTLRHLAALLPDLEKRRELAALVESAIEATEFARDWRNRHIAHRDLARSLQRPTEPLAPASRDHVAKALVSFEKVLNCVSLHYVGSTTVFEFGSDPTAGGALSVLHYLRAGREAELERKPRMYCHGS